VVVSWWEKRRRGRSEWEELGICELRGRMWRSKRRSWEMRDESMAANFRDSMIIEKRKGIWGNENRGALPLFCFVCIVFVRA